MNPTGDGEPQSGTTDSGIQWTRVTPEESLSVNAGPTDDKKHTSPPPQLEHPVASQAQPANRVSCYQFATTTTTGLIFCQICYPEVVLEEETFETSDSSEPWNVAAFLTGDFCQFLGLLDDENPQMSNTYEIHCPLDQREGAKEVLESSPCTSLIRRSSTKFYAVINDEPLTLET
ncbi:hypothetical protein SEMRO_1876_G303070.1 [Seminavis robusta]|uniref:Uncharacterized protein n=1 Tax=Seminavis robusta TaxID=568900 RepID=A0A9N8EW98_9STRA|nr:hypothetical protein SEMRO_1876_G303070.1 [Seminavis robusta]|eukprot:Sro1876_g303070.1 n/a (175) ;mRNA; r:8574-9275